ncbi:MAG: hypothetical protein FJ291_06555 [Planctomycetes bacterium]|nr:hypothetical protein [Planctomycetota bacterium]
MSARTWDRLGACFILLVVAALPAIAASQEPELEVSTVPETPVVGEGMIVRVTAINGTREDVLIPKAHHLNLLVRLQLIRPDGRPEEPRGLHDHFLEDIDPSKRESYVALKPNESFTYEVPLSERDDVRPMTAGQNVLLATVRTYGRAGLSGRKALNVVKLDQDNVQKVWSVPLRGQWWTKDGDTGRVEKVALGPRSYLFYRELEKGNQRRILRLCDIPRESDFVAAGSAAGISIAFPAEGAKLRYLFLSPPEGRVTLEVLLPDGLPAVKQQERPKGE